jgi:hypothetical protein
MWLQGSYPCKIPYRHTAQRHEMDALKKAVPVTAITGSDMKCRAFGEFIQKGIAIMKAA